MLTDRNNTSHIYKQETARQIFQHLAAYLPIFLKTYAKLKSMYRLKELYTTIPLVDDLGPNPPPYLNLAEDTGLYRADLS
jgi:Nucleotidyltransferase substrate binding protein like